MFRTAELGRSLTDAEFDERVEDLRLKLLVAQHQLQRSGDFQVLVDLAGVSGAGKGATVNALHAWLDTRLLFTRSYTDPSEEERQRPQVDPGIHRSTSTPSSTRPEAVTDERAAPGGAPRGA